MRWRAGAVLALALAGCTSVPAPPPPAAAQNCVPVGRWATAAGPVAVPDLFRRLAEAGVVLLGETHDEAAQHRWEAQTLAGLHAYRPDFVIGVEMLPRRAQAALDRWVAGAASEAQFLAESRWTKVWGFDFALYRPVFEFARMNRVPMLALNVERSLVARVAREGWAATGPGDREGVSTPAPALPAYVDRLVEVYRAHDGAGSGPIDRSDPKFRRFIDAQLVWDRAMAEAIVAARRAGAPLVAGLMGRGHVEGRLGVPYQLAMLGERAEILLPWPADRDCRELTPGLADAVFGLEAAK
jgi:uncharacterized iron-regulated protein